MICKATEAVQISYWDWKEGVVHDPWEKIGWGQNRRDLK